MSAAHTEKAMQKDALPVAAVIPSDYRCTKNTLLSAVTVIPSDCRRRQHTTLSKRESERGGELNRPPLSHSIPLVPYPNKNPTLPAYAGAVSRWCDLTGHVVDATGPAKGAAELAAFNAYLDQLSETTKPEPWEFT